MSFIAQLTIAGKQHNILDCNYALHQEVDATGRPSSVTRGGKINLRIESTEETEMFEWMCNNFERKDGTITFFARESGARMKELNFKEGYLVDFDEQFQIADQYPMTITMTISAREISLGSGVHTNEWV